MTMSDPLGDMLTRIRNGQQARKNVVSSPASRMRSNVLEVLKRRAIFEVTLVIYLKKHRIVPILILS